jgi:histidinol-phosphate aminotransferase
LLNCINSRLNVPLRKKINKREYLNLKSNENHAIDIGLHGLLTQSICLENLVKYPVFDEAYLEFTRHLGVENIILTSGCHDAIRIILSNLDKKTNRILLCAPNYDGYHLYLELNEIPHVACNRDPANRHDTDSLVDQALKNKCNLIILTNPDPYVGDYLTTQQISHLLGRCDEYGITVIIDEVYSGLGKQGDVLLVNQYENLIILNSLSKSYGLPGVRVGWVCGSKKNIDLIGCFFSESNLSGGSLQIAINLLRNPIIFQQYRDRIKNYRQALIDLLLDTSSITPYEKSVTNFVLFKFLNEPKLGFLWEFLLDKGIYIANLSKIKKFESHYRVTVCAPRDQERLIDSIKSI